MNMENFDKSIWHLHRKLFHRYVKYAKYFRQATNKLPEFQKAKGAKRKVIKEYTHASSVVPTPAPKRTVTTSVIDLVSSSSDEVSEDDQEESSEEKV